MKSDPECQGPGSGETENPPGIGAGLIHKAE